MSDALPDPRYPAKIAGAGTYRAVNTYTSERGAVVIPLQKNGTRVVLTGR